MRMSGEVSLGVDVRPGLKRFEEKWKIQVMAVDVSDCRCHLRSRNCLAQVINGPAQPGA